MSECPIHGAGGASPAHVALARTFAAWARAASRIVQARCRFRRAGWAPDPDARPDGATLGTICHLSRALATIVFPDGSGCSVPSSEYRAPASVGWDAGAAAVAFEVVLHPAIAPSAADCAALARFCIASSVPARAPGEWISVARSDAAAGTGDAPRAADPARAGCLCCALDECAYEARAASGLSRAESCVDELWPCRFWRRDARRPGSCEVALAPSEAASWPREMIAAACSYFSLKSRWSDFAAQAVLDRRREGFGGADAAAAAAAAPPRGARGGRRTAIDIIDAGDAACDAELREASTGIACRMAVALASAHDAGAAEAAADMEACIEATRAPLSASAVFEAALSQTADEPRSPSPSSVRESGLALSTIGGDRIRAFLREVPAWGEGGAWVDACTGRIIPRGRVSRAVAAAWARSLARNNSGGGPSAPAGAEMFALHARFSALRSESGCASCGGSTTCAHAAPDTVALWGDGASALLSAEDILRVSARAVRSAAAADSREIADSARSAPASLPRGGAIVALERCTCPECHSACDPWACQWRTPLAPGAAAARVRADGLSGRMAILEGIAERARRVHEGLCAGDCPQRSLWHDAALAGPERGSACVARETGELAMVPFLPRIFVSKSTCLAVGLLMEAGRGSFGAACAESGRETAAAAAGLARARCAAGSDAEWPRGCARADDGDSAAGSKRGAAISRAVAVLQAADWDPRALLPWLPACLRAACESEGHAYNASRIAFCDFYRRFPGLGKTGVFHAMRGMLRRMPLVRANTSATEARALSSAAEFSASARSCGSYASEVLSRCNCRIGVARTCTSSVAQSLCPFRSAAEEDASETVPQPLPQQHPAPGRPVPMDVCGVGRAMADRRDGPVRPDAARRPEGPRDAILDGCRGMCARDFASRFPAAFGCGAAPYSDFPRCPFAYFCAAVSASLPPDPRAPRPTQ